MRCAPKTSRICCDLHDGAKALIDTLYPPATIARPPPEPRRSSLKDFVATPSDMELKNFLNNWRVSKVLDQFGQGGLMNFGPGVVMQNETLTRIVDCAHHDKINSIADLKNETKWDGADVHGEEVLDLIRKAHPPPPPPFTTVPLPQHSGTSSGPLPKAKRDIRCGACGEKGHMSECSSTVCCLPANHTYRKQ